MPNNTGPHTHRSPSRPPATAPSLGGSLPCSDAAAVDSYCRGRVATMLVVWFVLGCFAVSAAAAPPKRRSNAGGKSGGLKKAPASRLPASVRKAKRVEMDVAPVQPTGREKAVRAARKLDNLIETKLSIEGVRPNKLASDAVFLRRVYLDVAGRIPSLAEAREFLDSSDRQRRMNLIDRLLGSPDYVSHNFNQWADTLRLAERPQANMIAEPFAAYVKESIRDNKAYDAWVYEMLTADGKMWDNPAVGFQLRDDGMKLPYVDNTVRVFLGTQIGCAQCHDHPFDQWSQYQFYELAAFTHGTTTRLTRGDPGFEKDNPASALIREARKHYPNGRVPGAFNRIARANTFRVAERKRTLRLPHDYAYGDAKPNEVVRPAVLWGEIPSSARNGTPREQFAAWLTSPANEAFSKTVVNRLWKRFFGVGFVDPVDDFRDEHPCVNEAAMEHLCDELQRESFDLKQLQRVLLYSKTYQREASDYSVTSGELFYFPGPTVRRMRAEQVWDSILTLAVKNPLPFERPTAAQIARYVDIDFAEATYESVLSLSEEFAETYFLNRYRRNLSKQHGYKGQILCRASELPAPLPADHFLRQFGQGDRETIDGSQQEATVPQILAMFNGPITHVMLEPGSAIVDDVLEERQVIDRIDAIFLSVLGRRPTPADRRTIARELAVQPNRNVSFGNIIWALLNTREFLFIQ